MNLLCKINVAKEHKIALIENFEQNMYLSGRFSPKYPILLLININAKIQTRGRRC